ncbi:MAG: hypothetical protein IIA00_06045 [Proteobacteria bacterium]|nr:hypothetical protein [Pseudomonadota bacterium]
MPATNTPRTAAEDISPSWSAAPVSVAFRVETNGVGPPAVQGIFDLLQFERDDSDTNK